MNSNDESEMCSEPLRLADCPDPHAPNVLDKTTQLIVSQGYETISDFSVER